MTHLMRRGSMLVLLMLISLGSPLNAPAKSGGSSDFVEEVSTPPPKTDVPSTVVAPSVPGKGDTSHSDALINLLANSTVSGEVLISPTITTPTSAVYIAPTSSATNIDALPKDPTLPKSIVAPTNATDLGTLTLKGQTLSLQPGVYKASSVSLTSDAVVYTTGKVDLYVNGSLYQHGGLLYGQTGTMSNLSQFSPKDLRIFVIPTGDAKQSVKFEGGLTAAVVYAEDLSVTVDPNHVFIGSVIGKGLNVTNSSVYYPTDLSNLSMTVNSSAPVAELLWFRSQRMASTQATSGFLPGDVAWNPDATTIPTSNLLVWGDSGNGWYTWPGSPPSPPSDGSSGGGPNGGSGTGCVSGGGLKQTGIGDCHPIF